MAYNTTLYSRRAGMFLGRMLKERGYTQERFAEEFGVSARHVRRWLRDGINSLDTVQQLQMFFGVRIKDIFFDEGDILDHFFTFFSKADVTCPCAA